IVENLSATTRFQAGEEKRMLFGDWESTLHRRGFPQIISHFIDCVSTRATPSISLADALKTHEICERVVAEIAGQRGFEN
ncbi:MAG: oxidoreductase, partial [Paucimonas sp.]|nr:oxidoreductase [Paucimonas sp.]